jgi:glycosyltransferase involved in cell wall biosynthesis
MTPTAQQPHVLVFADDWGRHPSSCQHLVRHLLPRRQVVWVNTIGTRPPRLDWSTAQRAAGKLKQWFFRPKGRNVTEAELDPDHHPRVVSPKMWPSFKSAFARRLNRRLLLRALRPVVDALPRPPVVVTTLPLVADLVGQLPAERWVYYCVDDFSVWPGYDGETMLRMERDLVPKVDEVIAVSETLQQHVADLGKPSRLLTHGVDLDFWRKPPPPGPPPELAGLPPPYIVFWGVVDRRMDTAFVEHLAAHLPAGTVVLVGPHEDPDPRMLATPRVAAVGRVGFDRLPALAAAAGVLVMPYADLPVTRAIQPLKLKEYLATGKPAVVRDLPANRPWADCLDVVSTADDFARMAKLRCETGLPEEQRRARERLRDESWEAKAAQFAGWLRS